MSRVGTGGRGLGRAAGVPVATSTRAWRVRGHDSARRPRSAAAATRLRRDWYYRHAAYFEREDGEVIMSIPDTDPESVLPLVRWLGGGTRNIDRLMGQIVAAIR